MAEIRDDVVFEDLVRQVEGQTEAAAKGLVFFDLDETPWFPLHMEPRGGGAFPPVIVEHVDLVSYFAGMELQVLDFGSFNINNVRIPPGFRLPRHYHNIDQLVFVLEGSAVQGNQELTQGRGYFTRAGHPYSLTAGDEGFAWMEIRSEPLAGLETTWIDTDPVRWQHRR